jgi:hypothetical protein
MLTGQLLTRFDIKCGGTAQVPLNGVKYFWNLNVGSAVANTAYYFDDITLTSEPNAQYDNWVANAPVSSRGQVGRARNMMFLWDFDQDFEGAGGLVNSVLAGMVGWDYLALCFGLTHRHTEAAACVVCHVCHPLITPCLQVANLK